MQRDIHFFFWLHTHRGMLLFLVVLLLPSAPESRIRPRSLSHSLASGCLWRRVCVCMSMTVLQPLLCPVKSTGETKKALDGLMRSSVASFQSIARLSDDGVLLCSRGG